MLDSLKAIKSFRNGDVEILNKEKWLNHLVNTSEINVNYARINSLKEAVPTIVLDYVEKTLEVLNRMDFLTDYQRTIIEEVLKWSEVAKCGSAIDRQSWKEQGFNLFAHNLGSAEIFRSEFPHTFYTGSNIEIVYTLIKTHGLVGQTIKGEVELEESIPLFELKEKYFETVNAFEIIYCLNECIISGISKELWNKTKISVRRVITAILSNDFVVKSLQERLTCLRKSSIFEGENFNELYFRLTVNEPEVIKVLETLKSKSFWYLESALGTFKFEEFIKVLLIATRLPNFQTIDHLDFSPMMKGIHYDYRGEKQVNIYKKRIIEKLLASFSYQDILVSDEFRSPHLFAVLQCEKGISHGFFDFSFSLAANKLIEFCEVAENTGTLYEKAIILLYDLFELRRDDFDRLHNETSYLSTMNQNVDDKSKVLQHIVGDNVLDIGPGGGIMLDLMEDAYPEKRIVGIDVSENVIQELNKKKVRENRSWDVVKGDAFDLGSHFAEGEVDTIIFSSVLHELFSFVPYKGQLFNPETIEAALKSAYAILPVGGRIIIRDGIKSEPINEWRVIRFKEEGDMSIFLRYVNDFKGRSIEYEKISNNEVLLPINDAMEFLYTYTWGEDSYNHEVKEQFGYFTPTEYEQTIKEMFGEGVDVVINEHYLQNGYEEFLLPKVEFLNLKYEVAKLPDSTCFIVIEKK